MIKIIKLIPFLTLLIPCASRAVEPEEIRAAIDSRRYEALEFYREFLSLPCGLST